LRGGIGVAAGLSAGAVSGVAGLSGCVDIALDAGGGGDGVAAVGGGVGRAAVVGFDDGLVASRM